MDPFELARQAAVLIAERSGSASHHAAVVLGSGWSPAADALGATIAEIPMADLPGFSPPAAEGHLGTIRSVESGPNRVLVFLGRTHLYEGLGVAAVAHQVRTAAATGARTVILTNGAGSMDGSRRPGTPVLIADHINLTGTSPVSGATFVDLTDLYSQRLRDAARAVDPALEEGIYIQVPGPHYETPAEIRYLRRIGGDLVGMSTALEAIAAREAGIDVLGISLVTNPAAGVTDAPLDHADVLATGAEAAPRLGELLAKVIGHL
ncbi:MAG TPA: purine-nucleoside phosphorylase [Aeromicrobium sp.]|nr:purine-nucleoside phosphorylase [Aeromicrobium sp.]